MGNKAQNDLSMIAPGNAVIGEPVVGEDVVYLRLERRRMLDGERRARERVAKTVKTSHAKMAKDMIRPNARNVLRMTTYLWARDSVVGALEW